MTSIFQTPRSANDLNQTLAIYGLDSGSSSPDTTVNPLLAIPGSTGHVDSSLSNSGSETWESTLRELSHAPEPHPAWPFNAQSHLAHPPPNTSTLDNPLTSHTEVMAFLQSFAKAQGFAVATTWTTVNNQKLPKDKRHIVKLDFQCKFAGKYDPEGKRSARDKTKYLGTLPGPKVRLSMKRGCLWAGTARSEEWSDSTSPWSINITCNTHNHPAASPIILSEHQKLPDEARWMAEDMFNSTIANHDIARTIESQFPGTLVKAIDIKNLRSRWNQRRATGSTEGESLVNWLEERTDLVHHVWLGFNGQIKGIMFTSQNHLALSSRFPYVFSLDVTYKTNRYGLYLFHIVGMTATNHTFTSASMFMMAE